MSDLGNLTSVKDAQPNNGYAAGIQPLTPQRNG